MFPFFYLAGVFLLIFPTVRLPGINISPSDLFLLSAAALLGLEHILRRKDWRFAPHILWIPAILAFVGGTLATMNAARPATSLLITIKIFFVLGIWISMTLEMVRRGYLLLILCTVVSAGVFTAFVGIVDYWMGWSLDKLVTGTNYFFWNRIAGTLGHPNALGFYLTVALPIAFAMLLNEWQTKSRIVVQGALLVSCVVMGLALFYSGSVSSWIGGTLSLGTLGFAYLWRASQRTRLIFVVLVSILGVIGIALLTQEAIRTQVAFLINFNLGRAVTITGPDRFRLLDQAFSDLNANPFLGSGLDQAGTGGLDADELLTSASIHSTVISSWQNGGFLTFIGILMAYAVAVICAAYALKYGILYKNWIVVGLAVVTFSWTLTDQTQSQLTLRYTWLTLGLLFGLGFGIRWISALKVPPLQSYIAQVRQHSEDIRGR